jgi:hypothetical protein
MKDKCGCGRPAKYSTPGNEDGGSCNKYSRCPTYEQLANALELSNRRLACYQKAINKIDDYFEYNMDSNIDQRKVFQILGNLTDNLVKII